MEIEKVKISDLLEYKYNAKEHPEWQIEQIVNSIKKFGFNDPIAIDENNTIIEGHGRLYALQELGYDEVDCIRLSHLRVPPRNDIKPIQPKRLRPRKTRGLL